MKTKLSKDKLNKTFQAILIVLIIFTVGFIWSNSLKPVPQSDKQSDEVAQQIENIATQNNSKDESEFVVVLTHNIRKTAHIVEFLVLEIEIYILFLIRYKGLGQQTLWNVFSIPFFIAVMDEALQIVSRRGPKVQDILIDTIGIILGIVIVSCLYYIICKIKKKINNKKEM